MNGIFTPTGALRAKWAILMVLVAAVLAAGSSWIYTAHQQRESDQRWCALLATLDTPGAPAETERGRQIQRQVHELRRSLGCGDVR